MEAASHLALLLYKIREWRRQSNPKNGNRTSVDCERGNPTLAPEMKNYMVSQLDELPAVEDRQRAGPAV
jgi:hypothetical protein